MMKTAWWRQLRSSGLLQVAARSLLMWSFDVFCFFNGAGRRGGSEYLPCWTAPIPCTRPDPGSVGIRFEVPVPARLGPWNNFAGLNFPNFQTEALQCMLLDSAEEIQHLTSVDAGCGLDDNWA